MPLDLDRESFIGQLFAWSFDRNFFVDVALDQGWYDQVTQVGWFTFTSLIANQVTVDGQLIAGDPWNPSIEPDLCDITFCFFLAGSGWFAYLSVTFQELDFSNFHDQAIAVLQQIQQVEQGNAVMRSVVDIFESVLGPITCDGVDPTTVLVWDANKPPGYFEDAECFWYVVARYQNALHEDPAQDARIELRTRHVMGGISDGPQHLSVHDPARSVARKEWVSGFPENGPLLALLELTGDHDDLAGWLEGRAIEDSDHPDATVVAAFLSLDNVGLGPQWALVLNAKDNFDNASRDYCLIPFAGDPCFNSNSWAIGLVDALAFDIEPRVYVVVGGPNPMWQVPIEFSRDPFRFPGITNPVPAGDFQ